MRNTGEIHKKHGRNTVDTREKYRRNKEKRLNKTVKDALVEFNLFPSCDNKRNAEVLRRAKELFLLFSKSFTTAALFFINYPKVLQCQPSTNINHLKIVQHRPWPSSLVFRNY